MWSDNESDVDLLGFQHLVAGVLSIVHDDVLLPATIGVFGDWGSGKSSLLKMAAKELKKDEQNLVLIFNGWLFEGYCDAKTALMGNILDALAEDKTLLPQGKGLALKLLRRVNWWRAAGTAAKAGTGFLVAGPAGLGLAAGVDFAALGKDLLKRAEDLKEEDLTNYLKISPEHEERRSVREFRNDFATLLSQTERKRLVVVIDDLDRCLPETIIETLEAIKLFLFVDRTAFLIGADERLVKYAVRKRFPELPGERTEVGRDYLEKLIQFPIRIPPLGRVETEKYVSLLFALRGVKAEQFGAMRKAAIECDPKTLHGLRFASDVATKVLGKVEGNFAENLFLAERIAPILAAETTGNPRQCKRFMNMLSIRLGMAQSRGVNDLKPRVLAKLMLLEYYRTESFRQLATAQAEEEGKPRPIAVAEKQFREEPTPKKPQLAPAKAGAGGKAQAAATPDEEEATDLPLWLLDPWVIAWVRSEPALAGVDLRPYFYFSRDTLGPLGQETQRMSTSAQEVFKRLLSQSDAERKTGLTRASSLSPADASAVFEALAGRIREDDDFGSESSAFGRAIDWAKARRELVGQLAALLASLPEDRIPPATPIKLVELGNISATNPVRKLFTQWQRSSQLTLKAAAEQAMKRLT